MPTSCQDWAVVASITPLLGSEGRALLKTLPPYDSEQVFSLTSRLRAEGHSPELVSLALTQSRLRARAREKFGPFADTMFFTPAGLEQSTRFDVGVHHAARFRDADVTHVIDLGCGIGADCLAMAALGLRVTAIETDPETAAAARANLSSFPEAQVITADGLDIDIESLGADAIWLDPARRDGEGKRLMNPEQWSPRLSTALKIASFFPSAGIKVAPGIAHGLCPSDSHVQWISQDSDLLEAVIWLGRTATTPGRSALILRKGVAHVFDSGVGSADAHVAPVPAVELGQFLYEPDPAIIRSGGIARLCAVQGLAPVSPNIAYLTDAVPSRSEALSSGNAASGAPDFHGLKSGEIVRAQKTSEATEISTLGDREVGHLPEHATPEYTTRFLVREVLPLETKTIKKALNRAGISRLEIKKRGTDTDPEALRRKLGLQKRSGGKEAVLILTPLMGRHRAVLAHRA